MQLDRLLSDEARRPADLHLHGRHRLGPLEVVGLVEHQRRVQGHAARLLERDQHLGRAVLQRLEAGDGPAELVACLQVLHGRVEQRRHQAHGLGGQRGDRVLSDALDQRQRISRLPDRIGLVHAHPVQHDVRAAPAVVQAQGAARDAGCVRIDHEQRDPIAVAAVARHARAHQQAVGNVAVRHHRLGAPQAPAVCLALRDATHVVQAVARAGLAMRPCQHGLTRGDAGHPAHRLRVAGRAQRRCADHHRRQQGRERQRTRERLEHQHRVDGRAAESAMRGRIGQCQQADLGIACPQRAAEAFRRACLLPPLLEAAVARRQSLDAVLQHALVVVEREIHKPSTAFARMFFCTSLLPP